MDIRIGITTSFENGEQRLHRRYVQAVERAGALPMIVPMLQSEDAMQAFADLLDGLVITGGPAITDGLQGDLPDEIAETDPVRVASDMRIVKAFEATRRPMLGICYGMQLLNARAGGTIYADVERQHDGVRAHSQKRGATTHPLQLVEGTHLADVLGSTIDQVNTRHLQAIASVGSGYRVAATSPDGVVEAIENDDGTVLGVQFHPERMGEQMEALFQHLVDSARRSRQPPPASRRR